MRIGPYLVDEDSLAVGGQATIYRACPNPDAERIALKVVTPSQNVFVHDGKVRRLRREIEALRRLDHPNAPEVLDADPDGAWYAMPLARRDLGQQLEIGRIPWQTLRAGLLGVTSVIAKAHKLGLVHRDLHDANILIYPDRWCVGDWGFVYNSRVDRLTRQLTAFGRDFYIAPEILRDPAVVKPAVDVFAIGRLAERGAGLGSDRDSDTPAAVWWRTLIDGAGAYDERQRWTMADVLTHLKSSLPMSRPMPLPARDAALVPQTTDACPNCGSPLGFDQACRCLRCHAFAY